MKPGFRKLLVFTMLFVVLCFAGAHFLEASRFRPEAMFHKVEQYDVKVRVYFLNKDDYNKAVQFYFGPDPGEIIGLTVGNTSKGWIDIYMPKTVDNKVNILVLGHEFAHALDFSSAMAKSGYEPMDPDYEFGMGRLVLPEMTVADFRLSEHLARKEYNK